MAEVKGGSFFAAASATLPASTGVTVEALQAELERQFAGKYQIYRSALPGVDLIAKKSAWTGIAIRLKQRPDGTVLRMNPFSPSAAVRLLALGLIPILILWARSWKPMLEEFKEWVRTAPLFQ
jgi:hypothetical protein